MQNLATLETLIKEHPFLAGLCREFRNFLYACAFVRRFASQQQIFHEAGEADHFYLIVDGAVALEAFVPGSGMVTIESLGPGDALGCSWLFPPHKWNFTATTREPTEVISFDAAALRAKAEQDRDFCNELLARIARILHDRLLHTQRQLIDAYGVHL
jgi:CRP-like cAMP-binding protein